MAPPKPWIVWYVVFGFTVICGDCEVSEPNVTFGSWASCRARLPELLVVVVQTCTEVWALAGVAATTVTGVARAASTTAQTAIRCRRPLRCGPRDAPFFIVPPAQHETYMIITVTSA